MHVWVRRYWCEDRHGERDGWGRVEVTVDDVGGVVEVDVGTFALDEAGERPDLGQQAGVELRDQRVGRGGVQDAAPDLPQYCNCNDWPAK